MTELDLYKFITENKIEYHWHINKGVPDVIIHVDLLIIDVFHNLFDYHVLCNNELYCVLKPDKICFWIKDICEIHDIKMENIFTKTEEDKRNLGQLL